MLKTRIRIERTNIIHKQSMFRKLNWNQKQSLFGPLALLYI